MLILLWYIQVVYILDIDKIYGSQRLPMRNLWVDGIVHSLIINIILTISEKRKAEIKEYVINKLNISKERV